MTWGRSSGISFYLLVASRSQQAWMNRRKRSEERGLGAGVVEVVAATAFLALLLLPWPLLGSKLVLHLPISFDLLFCLTLRHVPKNLLFCLVQLIIVPCLFVMVVLLLPLTFSPIFDCSWNWTIRTIILMIGFNLGCGFIP
jgi:hypothetical protein